MPLVFTQRNFRRIVKDQEKVELCIEFREETGLKSWTEKIILDLKENGKCETFVLKLKLSNLCKIKAEYDKLHGFHFHQYTDPFYDVV